MEKNQEKGKKGRPKGSIGKNNYVYMKLRESLQKKVSKEWKEILQGQIDLAKGVVIKKQVQLSNGKMVDKYYQERPDIQAGKLLMDQTIGKPKEQIEHSGSIKSIVEIVNDLDKG